METEPMEREPMETEAVNAEVVEPVKKNPFKWLAIAALVVLLAAAAYVGGNLLNRQPAGTGLGRQGPVMEGGGPMAQNKDEGGESGGMELIPSDELPDRQPDANGIFVEREDKSLFIGTGSQFTVSLGEDGKSSSSYDGPVVEVVVNNDTEILRDVTEPPSDPSQSGTVQQVIEPGSLDEIGENSMVSVWGRKVGDRYIAEVLVYANPVFPGNPVK